MKDEPFTLTVEKGLPNQVLYQCSYRNSSHLCYRKTLGSEKTDAHQLNIYLKHENGVKLHFA